MILAGLGRGLHDARILTIRRSKFTTRGLASPGTELVIMPILDSSALCAAEHSAFGKKFKVMLVTVQTHRI